MRTCLVLPFAFAALLCGCGAATPSPSRDVLRTPRPGDVRVSGHVGAMQDRFFANRVRSDFAKKEIWDEARAAFAHPDDDVFKKPVGMWKGEFWGKLMISACRVAAATGDASLKTFLHDEGLRLIAFQQSDGYLGTYVDKEFISPRPEARTNRVAATCPDWNWNLWCRKYTLWGLLACYRLSGEPRLLTAADRAMTQQIEMLHRLGVKLCDTGTTAMRGLPPCSILKPLLWLHKDTGKALYLDYAREIVGYWNQDGNRAPQFVRLATSGKPMYEWYPSEIGRWAKAYEMMSCFDGLLEYYRVTGEASALELVKTLWKDIRANETNPCQSVGYNDQFVGAARLLNGITEPCDAIHWMRLSHDLFLLTGDPAYVDAIELAFYNAFLAGMRPDGTWGARCVRSHVRHQPAPPQSGMKLQHCCVNNFPRGFLDVAETMAVEAADGTVSVCLYHDARVKLAAGEVEISGGYPAKDGVTVRLTRKRAGKVRFRVPAWSTRMTVCTDEMCLPALKPGWLETEAKAGENKWEIHFALAPRIVGLDGRPYRPDEKPDLQSRRWGMDKATLRTTPAAEVFYGPLLLAKSVRVGDSEAQILDPDTVKGNGWKASLAPRTIPDGVWAAWTLTFEKDGRKKSVDVCDFPSAATWSEADTEFSIFF